MNNSQFERFLLDDLKKWIDRREIYAIKGPRQAGKTTLLKMLENWLVVEKKVDPKKIVSITFEDEKLLEKFARDPKTYVKSFVGLDDSRWYFFIDEFQYLEKGGRILKLLYDLYPNIKFIITGSSSLELTNKTAKFLVGRVFFFNLWPVTWAEFLKIRSVQLYNVYKEKNEEVRKFIKSGQKLKIATDDIFQEDFRKLFEEYALWGGYPAVIATSNLETKRIILKNIYNTYITEDITELLKIADHSLFKRLVAVLAAQNGNLLNYNNLATDIQSYFKEIKHYLSILEQTYIISLLTPYSTNRISELKKSPKIYFINTGLRNYILDNFNSLDSRSDAGVLVENTAFSFLKFDAPDNRRICFWRTLAGAEVDFVLADEKNIVPIEVKYSNFKFAQVSRSFRSFLEKYPSNSALILTKGFIGETEIGRSNIKFIPVWYLG
ncbi:MAG: hypothetical protein COX29_01545 [Candidatus Moranbacteria bacterium CG23_combo_of_CG06-09_8_20_14_all_35_22]|nr:MAG: hypothetical protein COX29_01545 [Candidatus Moranbacteria bacterium CG23_combo_of_CG06-09_8_20_14_all_35_22]